jgi:hypothetical protein
MDAALILRRKLAQKGAIATEIRKESNLINIVSLVDPPELVVGLGGIRKILVNNLKA